MSNRTYYMNVKLIALEGNPPPANQYGTKENVNVSGWLGVQVDGVDTAAWHPTPESVNLRFNVDVGNSETGWLHTPVKDWGKANTIKVGGHLSNTDDKNQDWRVWQDISILTEEVTVTFDALNKIKATFKISWQEKTGEPALVGVKKIKCVQEDDGAGSKEELFGTVTAFITPLVQFSDDGSLQRISEVTLWSRTEKGHESLGTGEELDYGDGDYKLLPNFDPETQKIVAVGHLKEDDFGHDDDFGEHQCEFKGTEEPDQTLTYTHDKSEFEVTVGVEHKPVRMFHLEYVKCIKPSTGADKATKVLLTALDVFEKIASVIPPGVPGVAVKVVGAANKLSKAIKASSSSTFSFEELFSDKTWLDYYKNTTWAGTDHLEVHVNGGKIFPNGTGSHDIQSGDTVPLNARIPMGTQKGEPWAKIKVQLWEIDSFELHDPLAEFIVDDSDLPHPLLEPKHFVDLIVNPEEGSSYEIGYSVAWYPEK